MNLEVYRLGLNFAEWFEREIAVQLSNRLTREVDNSATSMILNIAEGNGRYAHWITGGFCTRLTVPW